MSAMNKSHKNRLISKVLSLTKEQVYALPQPQQAQAMWIRQSYFEIQSQSKKTENKIVKPITQPPNKKTKLDIAPEQIESEDDTDDDITCIAFSDIELDDAHFTKIEYNWSKTAHYRNGMKGKSFGALGAKFGVMGSSFGTLTTNTPRKSRTTFSVFEKLNCIAHCRAVGSLSLTVLWKWGPIKSYLTRKQYKKYIKKWIGREQQLIEESLKVGGYRHGSVSIASHTFFRHEEEKYIRDKFNEAYDRHIPISQSDIVGWGWECAYKYGKADTFIGGAGWVRGWCERNNISIQVIVCVF
eukprot:148880_1